MFNIYSRPVEDFLKTQKIVETKVIDTGGYFIVEFFRRGFKFVRAVDQYYAVKELGRYVYSFSVKKKVNNNPENDSLTEEKAIHRAAMACFCYGNSCDGYRYYPGTRREFEGTGEFVEYVR
jgi:hypothetical protein